ncbi:hypothetical protein QTP86_017492, partial [Hemibagrus guttatus]
SMYTLSWKRYSLMAVASFLQDNAPCHKAEMVQEFEVLTRPPNFQDLNPIKHLWEVLDKQRNSAALRTPDCASNKISAGHRKCSRRRT